MIINESESHFSIKYLAIISFSMNMQDENIMKNISSSDEYSAKLECRCSMREYSNERFLGGRNFIILLILKRKMLGD